MTNSGWFIMAVSVGSVSILLIWIFLSLGHRNLLVALVVQVDVNLEV